MGAINGMQNARFSPIAKQIYQPVSIHQAQLGRSYLYRFHVEFHAIVHR